MSKFKIKREKLEVISEYLSHKRVVKNFTIKLRNGQEIEICKWWEDGEIGCDYECDWEIVNEKDQKTYDKLSEENQDELQDFINDLD